MDRGRTHCTQETHKKKRNTHNTKQVYENLSIYSIPFTNNDFHQIKTVQKEEKCWSITFCHLLLFQSFFFFVFFFHLRFSLRLPHTRSFHIEVFIRSACCYYYFSFFFSFGFVCTRTKFSIFFFTLFQFIFLSFLSLHFIPFPHWIEVWNTFARIYSRAIAGRAHVIVKLKKRKENRKKNDWNTHISYSFSHFYFVFFFSSFQKEIFYTF